MIVLWVVLFFIVVCGLAYVYDRWSTAQSKKNWESYIADCEEYDEL